MAKKTSKKEKNEIELTDKSVTSISNENVTLSNNVVSDTIKEKEKTASNGREYEKNLKEKDVHTLNSVSIEELISYEKACALICRRYESAARIDYMDHRDKFNKYKKCYEEIFSELEYRIDNLCK